MSLHCNICGEDIPNGCQHFPQPRHSEQQEWTASSYSVLSGAVVITHAQTARTARTIADAHNASLTAERQRLERLIEATHEVYKEQLARLKADYTRELNAKLGQINKQAETITAERNEKEDWRQGRLACEKQLDATVKALADERQRRERAERDPNDYKVAFEAKCRELLSALAAIERAILRAKTSAAEGERMLPEWVIGALQSVDLSLLHKHVKKAQQPLVDTLERHKEWMEEDGMGSDGVPIHDCDFKLNPEAGTCEYHELYAATIDALAEQVSIEEQIAREAFEELSNSEWKDGVSIIINAIRRAVAIQREIVAKEQPDAICCPICAHITSFPAGDEVVKCEHCLRSFQLEPNQERKPECR